MRGVCKKLDVKPQLEDRLLVIKAPESEMKKKFGSRHRPLSHSEDHPSSKNQKLTGERESWSDICSARNQSNIKQNSHRREDNEIGRILSVHSGGKSRCPTLANIQL
jgi:hypothetical protein